MPRFYLHVCNGNGFVEDSTGRDLADLEDARQTAVSTLRATLAQDVVVGNINVAAFVEIEDDDRRHVGTVHFSDAIGIQTENGRDARS
jgi:hypothetical protein